MTHRLPNRSIKYPVRKGTGRPKTTAAVFKSPSRSGPRSNTYTAYRLSVPRSWPTRQSVAQNWMTKKVSIWNVQM
jgi:hypothetical protein